MRKPISQGCTWSEPLSIRLLSWDGGEAKSVHITITDPHMQKLGGYLGCWHQGQGATNQVWGGIDEYLIVGFPFLTQSIAGKERSWRYEQACHA